MFSGLNPAARALAKAIPCSFCSIIRRASRALKRRCLRMKNKVCISNIVKREEDENFTK
jgi:hypothetical protein